MTIFWKKSNEISLWADYLQTLMTSSKISMDNELQ